MSSRPPPGDAHSGPQNGDFHHHRESGHHHRLLQVTLNISHPYDSDLFIFLEAPNGTEVLLVNHRGGSGHNFVNTVLSDARLQGNPCRLGAVHGDVPAGIAAVRLAGRCSRRVDAVGGEQRRRRRRRPQQLVADHHARLDGPAEVSGDLVRALTQAMPAEPTLAPVAPRVQHAAVVDAVFAAMLSGRGGPWAGFLAPSERRLGGVERWRLDRGLAVAAQWSIVDVQA